MKIKSLFVGWKGKGTCGFCQGELPGKVGTGAAEGLGFGTASQKSQLAQDHK